MDLLERRGTVTRRHPWETARAAFFAGLAPKLHSRDVLDVGAGDAWFSAEFAKRSPTARVLCWDSGYTPERLEQLRANGSSQVYTAVAPDGTFDLVFMLDVIEHVRDDVGFVRDVVTRLRPGGTAIVSVPAWPSLFGPHDLRLGHYRRYRPAEGRRLVTASGLVVEEAGGLFHALLPIRAATAWRERYRNPRWRETAKAKEGAADLGNWSGGAGLTSLLHTILRLENHVSLRFARMHIPLPGLSWWARCRKP